MPGGQRPPVSVILSWPKKGSVTASETARHGTVIWLCVLLFLSVLVMAARMRARRLRKNYGMDDWLLLASLIPTIAMVVVSSLGLERYGFGEHIWNLDITTLIEARKVVFATEITFLWASSLIKLSILCFYTRLARDSMTSRYIAMVRWSMAFIVVYLFTFTLVLCLTCRPFSAFWTQIYEYLLPKHNFTCVNEGASLLANTGISIIQDFLTTSLPFTLFWSLAMPRRQKIALGAIFALGFLACITGVMRFYYLYVMYYKTYDVTYVARDTLAWTTTELLVGTICASAPALKIYFRTLLPSHTSNNHNGPDHSSNNVANAQPPTLLSFHHSHPSEPRRSRNCQPSLSLFRRTQDSFVRLDDDEENIVGVGVGVAQTTDEYTTATTMMPTMSEKKLPSAEVTRVPSDGYDGSDVSPVVSGGATQPPNSLSVPHTKSVQTTSYHTTPNLSSSSDAASPSLYWPKSRIWSEKIDGIGSIASDTEMSELGSSSYFSSPALSTTTSKEGVMRRGEKV